MAASAGVGLQAYRPYWKNDTGTPFLQRPDAPPLLRQSTPQRFQPRRSTPAAAAVTGRAAQRLMSPKVEPLPMHMAARLWMGAKLGGMLGTNKVYTSDGRVYRNY